MEVATTMTTVLDATRTREFAGQALGMVNGGFLSLMLSVGHRTGLFDTLAVLPPSTSDQIAAAAGLNERYVREWLGAMVTGRRSSRLERNLDNPLAPFLFAVSTMHCTTVSLAQGGEGLGAWLRDTEASSECSRGRGGFHHGLLAECQRGRSSYDIPSP